MNLFGKAYIKSPMNYIGNKYRIIGQIKKFFPKKINTMLDLFCGGLDVTINTEAKKHYANDINHFIISIFKCFQRHSTEAILHRIDKTLDKWKLSQTNEKGFKKFRDYYNETKKPVDLFILMCYSFNHQIRFNSNHHFNTAFGKNKSSFNKETRINLVQMLNSIDDIHFTAKDFRNFDFDILKSKKDFLYADPPYLITCGSYNDGKRGFTGWTEREELDLYNILNNLSNAGIKFALSNVIEHKGRKNKILDKWCKQNDYNLHKINFNYDSCNYHAKNTDKVTKEVLITNY